MRNDENARRGACARGSRCLPAGGGFLNIAGMSTDSKPRKILFVCLGNICRSPAAEGVFAKFATEAGLAAQGVTWDSCGTGGWHAGDLPDPRMIAAAAKRGYTLTHRARKITPEDFKDFDLLLTMDNANLDDLCRIAPNHAVKFKIKPLADYLRVMESPIIPDPYYDGPEAFENVLDLLEDACRTLVDELK